MVYSIKYKRSFGLFWKTIRGVIGDSILETDKGQAQPVRVIFLEDKSRLEIPLTYLIKFSKERFYAIEESMKNQGAQNVR